MARTRDKLSARQVGSLASGRKHSDGGGLYLRVDNNSRRWVYAFTLSGREREMGLGAWPGVTLAAARKARNEAEALVKDGRDPIAARDAALKAETGKPTFGEAAIALIAAKASQWRNAKHAAQWTSTIETYCASVWSKPVDEIDTEAVLSVLQPIWTTKPETASRLRGRMEAVLDAARARGHIAASTANPARWRGHLDKLLAQRAKLSRGHHVALPYAQLPAFLARLRERPAVAAMALEFTILTAARTGEVLGATWAEIDLEAKVWTIPAARMKAAREHRIPLAARPVAILQDLARTKVGAFVFPGQRSDRPLSSAAMEMLLRRMGGAHAKNTKTLTRGTDKTDETPSDASSVQKKSATAQMTHRQNLQNPPGSRFTASARRSATGRATKRISRASSPKRRSPM